MSTRKISAVETTCDGCGATTITSRDEPAEGLYINWSEIGPWGGNAGKIFACNLQCATKALEKRNEK